MKAFFARQISNTAESAGGTMSNEQKVHIPNLIMTLLLHKRFDSSIPHF
jgi:hypothetical protein